MNLNIRYFQTSDTFLTLERTQLHKKNNTMKYRNSEHHLSRSCCNRVCCLRRSEICGLVNLRDLGNINREGGVVLTLHKHQSIHNLLPFIQYHSISNLQ